MGGERASTVRQREAGKICCNCHTPLSEPHTGRETYCQRCGPTFRVCCTFMVRGDGWFCNFMEPDLKTTVGPRPGWYRIDPDRIRDFQQNYGANRWREDFGALEYALNMGRGSIWLNLPREHYKRLQEHRR